MALLSAYATTAEYRARVSDKTTGSDSTLEAQLLACSRLLDRDMGLAPGAFNAVGDENPTPTPLTLTFDGPGLPVLYLRDRSGSWFLRSAIDDEITLHDGTVLALDGEEVRGLPGNAAAVSEPYTALERLDGGVWPCRSAAVTIVAVTGWATVPGIIVDLTVHLAHDLATAHLGGAVQAYPAIDDTMPLSDNSWRMWKLAKGLYGRWAPL